MAENYVQSSPVLKYSDGTLVATDRVGPQGNSFADGLHGPLYESSRNGTLFWAANQAAQAVSVALTLTYTGLALYNPVGNNRDLIVRAFSFTPSVAQVALSVIGLMAGYISTGAITAHTTPLVTGTSMGPMNFGSAATPTALADSAATIVGPKIVYCTTGTALAAAGGYPTIGVDGVKDVGGGLILQPGSFAAIYALTALTGISAFVWEEVMR
jgi:hypothetical protein